MTFQKIVTPTLRYTVYELYPIINKFLRLVTDENCLQDKTSTIISEVTSKFKSVFEDDDFVKRLSEIKSFFDDISNEEDKNNFDSLIEWLQTHKYISTLLAKSEEEVGPLDKLKKITEFYNIINQVNEFLEIKGIKPPIEYSKSQPNWTPRRDGIKVNQLLTNTKNNPNPTELEPLQPAKQVSNFVALFNKKFYKQITHKQYKSLGDTSQKTYYILKDTENDEVNSDKSSETENTKISYCPLSQILESLNDEKIKKDTVNFIDKSINQAINSCVNKKELDSKIKWFKYFLIAIKLQGIGNKIMECQNLLNAINKNENLSEADLLNFNDAKKLPSADLLNFNDAKKLSSLFQINTMRNNIFTGRVEDYTRPKKVVGMRTKRIPLSLLMSVAEHQLNKEDFKNLQIFQGKLNQNSFNSTPDSSLTQSNTSNLKNPPPAKVTSVNF